MKARTTMERRTMRKSGDAAVSGAALVHSSLRETARERKREKEGA